MEITALKAEDVMQIPLLVSGYQTGEIYAVVHNDTETEAAITLRLVALPQPINKRFPPLSEEDLEHYRAVAGRGFSYGLFNNHTLVAVALAEPHRWNKTLWVWEFHIADGYRGQGWGRLLMTRLIAQAQATQLRAIICETQNTNVPAMRFYRRLGFRVEALDISYYSNDDMNPDREVAVFMKRRLAVESAIE